MHGCLNIYFKLHVQGCINFYRRHAAVGRQAVHSHINSLAAVIHQKNIMGPAVAKRLCTPAPS